MTEQENKSWLKQTISPALPWLTVETLIFGFIVLLAIITRFYDLGTRVMSHDESLHTYFSYLLYKGQGYQHNPMMHGPFQFHLLALSYFIFGASDFTARIPAVLFSIGTIFSLWYWRRYLGKSGVLIAAFFMLISPYMLYYGRYVRNEAFVGLCGLLLLWSVLRYLETGEAKYIYWLTAATVLHFTVKETAFIYTAQMLLFLAAYFIARVTNTPWGNDPESEEGEPSTKFRGFLISLAVCVLLLGAALTTSLITSNPGTISGAETLSPAVPGQELSPLAQAPSSVSLPLILVSLGLIALAAAIYFLITGYTLQRLREDRAFSLLIVLGTLILPLLTPFLIKAAGFNPLDYSQQGLIYTSLFLVPVAIVATLIGMFWNKDVWWKAAILFYAIFTVFYTTLFTNGQGFFTGLIGSLGYWLDQQSVQRGSQPWYYYILIQVPLYEYLPFLASLFAVGISARKLKKARLSLSSVAVNLPNTLSLLIWWSFSSFLAYTLAGEKMPWLTYHITLPMILLGGWALGTVVDSIRWKELIKQKFWLALAVFAIFILSVIGVFISFLQIPAPFQSQDLAGLQNTSTFVLAFLTAILSGYGIVRMLDSWPMKQIAGLNLLVLFAFLALLTTRTALRASYITYDSGEEYLVYAHSYTGVKDALKQVAELSQKTTGGMSIVVAYDDDTSWPMSWYMREFPNARFYGSSPSRDLRDAPAIIVGNNNFDKVNSIVGDNYFRYDYIRMVWPNQDYFGLTWDRFSNAITDANLRAAIFDIWLNRDYKKYAEATGSTTTTVENWEPSDRMRLYIRKDVANLIWSYGASPVPPEPDPYEAGFTPLSADLIVGSVGTNPGELNAPRGLAFAKDGSFYIADSRNHRIQHFDSAGVFINQFGAYGDSTLAAAPVGAFNEPWSVAVGPDGNIYVTDTWNHRIQKFSAKGQPLAQWGVFGLPETPGALYGPRGIAVDTKNRIYVADTGNERIVIYDKNGTILSMFGTEGSELGQFFEPVDVDIDQNGFVYVTDTWNQRVQVFAPSGEDGLTFTPHLQWDIHGWFSESLENKPYLSIDSNNNVYITDPENFRVLVFSADGTFIRTWGEFGSGASEFGLASGIAVDPDGHIWVSDSGNNRIMRFSNP